MVSSIISKIKAELTYANINKSCSGLKGLYAWGEYWQEHDLDDFLFVVLGAYEHDIDITDIYSPHFMCSQPKYEFGSLPTIVITIELANGFCIYAKTIGYYHGTKGETEGFEEWILLS